MERAKIKIKTKFQEQIERKIKKILSKTKMCFTDMIDIEKTVDYGKNLISEHLVGKAY